MNEFRPEITPGPWKIMEAWEGYTVCKSDRFDIISQVGNYDIPALRHADAMAFCAIPELLKTMEAARKVVGATCTWPDLENAISELELAIENLDKMHGWGKE